MSRNTLFRVGNLPSTIDANRLQTYFEAVCTECQEPETGPAAHRAALMMLRLYRCGIIDREVLIRIGVDEINERQRR